MMKLFKNNRNIRDEFRDSYYGSSKTFAACPVCDENRFRIINIEDRHDIGLPIAMCQRCGMVTTNPRPDAGWYNKFYLDYFWQVYVGNNQQDLDRLFDDDHYAFKGERIGTLILQEMKKSECNYLDAGCGLGGLVMYLQNERKQWNIEAIEPSTSAAEYSRKRGIKVINSGFEQIPANDKKYDLISLVHVLEHCLDPAQVLNSLAGMLKEDGIIYVEIPDIMSNNWRGNEFFHIAHVHYFDTATFSLLLDKTPLTIKRTTPSPVPEYWPWATSYFLEKKSAYTANTGVNIPPADTNYLIARERKITGQIRKEQ